jgi:hypothetical protein
MASKQEVTTKKATKTAAAAAPAPAAKAVRAAKPKTPATSAKPRVSSAKHSKSVSPETTTPEAIISEPIAAAVNPVAAVNPHDAISKIAYGYWVARGCQPGNPNEDWIRAEREYFSE